MLRAAKRDFLSIENTIFLQESTYIWYALIILFKTWVLTAYQYWN